MLSSLLLTVLFSLSSLLLKSPTIKPLCFCFESRGLFFPNTWDGGMFLCFFCLCCHFVWKLCERRTAKREESLDGPKRQRRSQKSGRPKGHERRLKRVFPTCGRSDRLKGRRFTVGTAEIRARLQRFGKISMHSFGGFAGQESQGEIP